MLNKAQRDELKQKIKSEIASTRSLIIDLKEAGRPVSPDNAIGRLSRMEAINDQNMVKANLRTAEMRLPRLEQALDAIEEETFGLCQQCEEPIPFGRLLLIPEAASCIHCAGT